MDEPRPTWPRRQFLAGLLAAGATGAVACSGGGKSDTSSASNRTTTSGNAPARRAAVPREVRGLGPMFTLGVASGDPLPNSVILWTRLAPDRLHDGGMPAVDVPVEWRVAADERMSKVVAHGVAKATATHGHSVHVDAGGLTPGREYWYRFRVGAQESPVGRTRTAAAADASVDRLRFLFASCQNWKDGYWTAWPHAVEDDPDLVVYLGDYIYESGKGDAKDVRLHNSDEPTTLAGYRNRYGLYKGDAGLQAIHAQCPWVVTWDDHEVENNYAGSISEDRVDPSQFDRRRAMAYQAFWEHQPVRVRPPTGASLRLYRSFRWGRLLDLTMLDTRQYRDDQPCDRGSDLGASCPERLEPSRTILGAPQKTWLERQLGQSDATWSVIGNQVVMTPMPIGPVFNLDQWDGYAADRKQLLPWLARLANPVVVTGDIHANGVGDVIDEGAPDRTVATEFVGTSISSDFPAALVDVAETLVGKLPQVKWVDARGRGYVRCDVTPTELRADYRKVASNRTPTSAVATSRSWVVDAGRRGAREA